MPKKGLHITFAEVLVNLNRLVRAKRREARELVNTLLKDWNNEQISNKDLANDDDLESIVLSLLWHGKTKPDMAGHYDIGIELDLSPYANRLACIYLKASLKWLLNNAKAVREIRIVLPEESEVGKDSRNALNKSVEDVLRLFDSTRKIDVHENGMLVSFDTPSNTPYNVAPSGR
jgi:hypothetical protein